MFFLRKDNSMETTTLFYRQMAAMIASGVGIQEALEALGEQNESENVERLIKTITTDMDNGEIPGKGLTGFPEYLKKMIHYFVSGDNNNKEFSKILYSIADDNEKMEEMNKRIRSAMFYPVAIVTIAIIIMVMILVFVIPTFTEMFASFGSSLPTPTLIVISVSNFTSRYFYPLAAIALITVIYLLINKKVRHRLATMIPGYGGIVKNLAIIRFLKFLSIMLRFKAPLDEALELSAQSVMNLFYADKLASLKNTVSEKNLISDGLKGSEMFTPMVARMIKTGEQKGSIEDTLSEIANYYEKKLSSLGSFLQTFDILIMIIIGIIIGGFVVAMYLPIFQMGSAIV